MSPKVEQLVTRVEESAAPPKPRPKAIKFLVEWDDGTIWTAEGEIAAKVMQWYQSAETMNCIHGAKYSGPQITITKRRGE